MLPFSLLIHLLGLIMITRWFYPKVSPADMESVEGAPLPPGLQIHPIMKSSATPNRWLTLSLSALTMVLLSGSVFISILVLRQDLASQDHPKIISLLLEVGGDGQPAGPSSAGGAGAHGRLNPTPVAPSPLNTMVARLDPQEDSPETLIPRDEIPDKPLELFTLQPGILPSKLSGQGNGIGSGLGSDLGNGLGSGLGRGRGTTWIHSAQGDEEIKVLVNSVDTRDYIPPVYPRKAISRKISGDVVLAVTIDIDGTPILWKVVEGDPLLVEATLKVFPRWRFIPIVYKGEKVASSFEIAVRFTLM